MGLWTPKSENRDHFLSPTIPNNDGIDTCFTWISFSGKFWANFENRLIEAHSWSISPNKTPKSKTQGANGQYVSNTSENWYLGSSHIRDNRISKADSQKGIIHFEEHPTRLGWVFAFTLLSIVLLYCRLLQIQAPINQPSNISLLRPLPPANDIEHSSFSILTFLLEMG